MGPENPSNNGQQLGTTGRRQINDADNDGSAKSSSDCSHLDPEVRSSSIEDSIKRVYPRGETEKPVRPSTSGTADRRKIIFNGIRDIRQGRDSGRGVARGHGRGGRGSGLTGGKAKNPLIQCHYCKKTGPIMSQCDLRRAGYAKKKNRSLQPRPVSHR